MSHTVVRITNAKVTDQLKAEKLSQQISDELESRGYELNDKSIGENTDLDDNILLRSVTDHVYTGEADSWANFLQTFVESNMAEIDDSGEVVEHGFKSAIVDEHDCQHMEGKQQPCKPVEWEYEV